jgi:hypothetical protein
MVYGSKESKEQGNSGAQGGPRAGRSDEGSEGQAPQGSDRVENRREAEGTAGFEAGSAPSEQGRGSPRPDTIAEHQQGIGARSGSHGGAHGNVNEEEATRGAPKDEHARHGRQHVSGDRQRGD